MTKQHKIGLVKVLETTTVVFGLYQRVVDFR